jgi:hypothetical protein
MRRAIWEQELLRGMLVVASDSIPSPVNVYYILVSVEAELKLPLLHCETYAFSTNVYLVSVEVWLVLHHPCRSVEKIMLGGSSVVFHDDSLVSPLFSRSFTGAPGESTVVLHPGFFTCGAVSGLSGDSLRPEREYDSCATLTQRYYNP